MFLLGSCSSRPCFSLFICVTSCCVLVAVSHILFLTLLITHSLQFFLALVSAILAHCRLVFCCLPKPRPRLPAIPLSHLYYCRRPRHADLIRLPPPTTMTPPMKTTMTTTTTTTMTMTTTSPPSVRYATFAIVVRGRMLTGDREQARHRGALGEAARFDWDRLARTISRGEGTGRRRPRRRRGRGE